MRHLSFVASIMLALLTLTLTAELVDHFNLVKRIVKDNAYQHIEFLLLSFLYFKYFKAKKHRKVIALAVLFYFCVSIGLTLQYGLGVQNPISMSISHLTIVVCSLYYFRRMYEPPFESKSILANTLAWISFGNLIYFVGMFLYFGAEAMISGDTRDKSDALTYLNITINYTMYILYFMGAICHKIFK